MGEMMERRRKKVTKNAKERKLDTNAERQLHAMASVLVSRAAMAARLGKSFAGKRDLYEALGYPPEPGFSDYYGYYERQDIARRVVNAPVRASWRVPPRITESVDKDTKFEQAWRELVLQKNIYHYLSRIDKLASIGQYGVLLLGFDDGLKSEMEAKSAKRLLYLMPYSQANASIATSESDRAKERYGLPLTYTLTISSVNAKQALSPTVHWSRVIHVAEDRLDSEVLGTPALKPVVNRLIDLERVAGASSEMFWRGGFPGFGLKQDPDTTIEGQELEDLKDEVEEYVHSLRRYMRLKGISVENLAQQVADPSNHVSVLIDLIACAKDIPKRILMGSERGELASSQDERAWLEHIDERRRQHCEPVILRPFIDRLIQVKVLPEPKQGYTVEWPPLAVSSADEKSKVAQQTSTALAAYVNALGADQVIPQDIYLREVLGLSQGVIDEINRILGKQQTQDVG
jgi:hypothetical protein